MLVRRHRLREKLVQVRVLLGTWCKCYNPAQLFVVTVLASIFHGSGHEVLSCEHWLYSIFYGACEVHV